MTFANLAALPGDAAWAQGSGWKHFHLFPPTLLGSAALERRFISAPCLVDALNCDYSPSGMTAKNKQTPLPGATARLDAARGKAPGQRDNEEPRWGRSILCSDSARAQPAPRSWDGLGGSRCPPCCSPVPAGHRDPRGIPADSSAPHSAPTRLFPSAPGLFSPSSQGSPQPGMKGKHNRFDASLNPPGKPGGETVKLLQIPRVDALTPD